MLFKFGLQLDRFGNLLLSIAFLAVALQISRLVYLAPRRLLPLGSIAIISLLTFVCIPQLNLSAPATALAAYWGAIAPATLFASQQFILAFLGGEALHSKKALFLLYWFALGTLILGATGTLPMQLAIIPALATVLFQFIVSQMWRGLPQLFKNPLAWVDRTVHLWTLGWGSTLLFAVSAQVIQHLAAREFLSRRTIVFGLVLWQVVIVGRGVPLALIESALAARILNTATTVVVLGWMYLVLRACTLIVRTQLEPLACAKRSGKDEPSSKASGCCGRC
jgi:signal transduction histidine kinase